MCSGVEKTDEMKGEGKGLKNEDNGRNKIEKNLSFPPNIHRVVTMIEYLSLSGSGVTFGQLQNDCISKFFWFLTFAHLPPFIFTIST